MAKKPAPDYRLTELREACRRVFGREDPTTRRSLHAIVQPGIIEWEALGRLGALASKTKNPPKYSQRMLAAAEVLRSPNPADAARRRAARTVAAYLNPRLGNPSAYPALRQLRAERGQSIKRLLRRELIPRAVWLAMDDVTRVHANGIRVGTSWVKDAMGRKARNVRPCDLGVAPFWQWFVARVYDHVDDMVVKDHAKGQDDDTSPNRELADVQRWSAVDPQAADQWRRRKGSLTAALVLQLGQHGSEDVSVARQLWPGATARQREVIRLRYIEGLSVAEAASRLNLTPEAVRSHVSHARTRARQASQALPRLVRNVDRRPS